MREIIVDLSCVSDRKSLHKCFRAALAAPEHYGDNFDALGDILTEICEPTKIIIENISGFINSNKVLCSTLIKVLGNSESENENLIIFIDTK